jgi:hypothetical protein
LQVSSKDRLILVMWDQTIIELKFLIHLVINLYIYNIKQLFFNNFRSAPTLKDCTGIKWSLPSKRMAQIHLCNPFCTPVQGWMVGEHSWNH